MVGGKEEKEKMDLTHPSEEENPIIIILCQRQPDFNACFLELGSIFSPIGGAAEAVQGGRHTLRNKPVVISAASAINS